MRNKRLAVSFKFLAVVSAALALGACGSSAGSAALMSDSIKPESKDNVHLMNLYDDARLAEEESLLRSDPSCGRANEEFAPVILLIIERFNEIADEGNLAARGATLVHAGHPDMPGGVSVRVCADSRVAAYAYRNTVALHEGLIRMLETAAEAVDVLGVGTAGLEERLDEIASNAQRGLFENGRGKSSEKPGVVPADQGLSAEASELFTSAVAFVLYHELGHAQLWRAGEGRASPEIENALSPYAELEADFFAANLMRPAGFSMKGAELVFAILERISPQGSLGHPNSWERASTVLGTDQGETALLPAD